MKLHLAAPSSLHVVTGRGKGWVAIDGERYGASLILSPRTIVTSWSPRAIEELAAAHFDPVIELKPAVVLLGCGERLIFPLHAAMRPLIQAGIGFEVMALAAACSTYNVLAHEGRNVVAALIVG